MDLSVLLSPIAGRLCIPADFAVNVKRLLEDHQSSALRNILRSLRAGDTLTEKQKAYV